MAGIPTGPNTFFRISPAAAGSAQAFALKRGSTQGRLDARFHYDHERLHSRLDLTPISTPKLAEVLLSIASGATPKRSDSSLYADSGVKFLRILNVEDGELLEKDTKYITDAVHEGDLRRSQLAAGDVLMTITGRVGSAAVVQDKHLPANINQHVVRLRVDTRRCRPEFLSAWLNCPTGLELSNLPVSGGTRAALDYGAIRNIRIPLPGSLQYQDELVHHMDTARAERKAKSKQADDLIAGLDDFLFDTLGIASPHKPRNTFALSTKDLAGVINPGRYRGWQIEKHLRFKSVVGSVGYLLKRKFAPAKQAPEEPFDWIRIDELPNRPWQVETVRTELGKDISGTFFEVQEDDILIARLGPSMLNAKFVLCPERVRRTIASTEFLVLRCNRDYQPEAVLWLLRTALYREIMYLRSRGSTPSRFRLDGKDLLSIPFPKIDKVTQSAIVAEVRYRREESRRLRTESEAVWLNAKRQFEGQLLEPQIPVEG